MAQLDKAPMGCPTEYFTLASPNSRLDKTYSLPTNKFLQWLANSPPKMEVRILI